MADQLADEYRGWNATTEVALTSLSLQANFTYVLYGDPEHRVAGPRFLDDNLRVAQNDADGLRLRIGVPTTLLRDGVEIQCYGRQALNHPTFLSGHYQETSTGDRTLTVVLRTALEHMDATVSGGGSLGSYRAVDGPAAATLVRGAGESYLVLNLVDVQPPLYLGF
jgi:hypothetical protein